MYKQFYDNLNICLRNRNKKAYLIGGLTDLILDGHENFDCLEFLIPSWAQLCNPNNFPCHILNLNGLTAFDKKQLLPYIELAHKRLDYFKYSQDLFWPDGSHPNRLGHKVLYDTIKSKLNL